MRNPENPEKKTGKNSADNQEIKKRASDRTVSERTRKKTKKETGNSFFRMFFVTLWTIMKIVIPAAFLVGVVLVIFVIFSADKIDVSDLRLDLSSSVCYVDKDGNLKHYESVDTTENRDWVELNKVPQDMKDAFVSIEDERFYSHTGFDIKRTARAVLEYLKKGSGAQGGSTITQQLIKNLTENNDRTPVRKIQEIWMAYQLERDLSKDQILELYMNTIYLAQGVNGVQTASQLYFDKDVSELSLAQCASIAGITQYPSYYDPFINPENNKEKQRIVLKKMHELGYISKVEYDEALEEELVFVKGNMQVDSVRTQSYFTDCVVNDAIDALVREKGYSRALAERKLQSGGYKIVATLDIDIQRAIDKVFSSESNFPASSVSPGPQGAMVVMDPHTGEVKGLAGGIGKKEGAFSLNRATSTYRQPGSSVKPIGVYAPALDKGLIKPNTVYTDKKITYGDWSPKNSYTGFRGNMTVRTALRDSTNTVAVQVADDLGPDVSYDYLKNRFHISSLTKDDINLGALALGGMTEGVSVLDMTAAYAVFPAEGIYHTPITFTKIFDSVGNVVITNQSEQKNAIKKETAAMMNELLKNVVSSGTGTGAAISGMSIAGKTGTTDDNKDKWFVGYNADYVAGVWYGYDKPSPISGGNIAVSTWRKVMEPVLRGKGQSKRASSAFWNYSYEGYYDESYAKVDENTEDEENENQQQGTSENQVGDTLPPETGNTFEPIIPSEPQPELPSTPQSPEQPSSPEIPITPPEEFDPPVPDASEEEIF